MVRGGVEPPTFRFSGALSRFETKNANLAAALLRVQFAYGARLRRIRATTVSRAHLTAAPETFERLGARPWAAQASSELRATGRTRSRSRVSAHEPLTPQECEIAMLAASGVTTKQIAPWRRSRATEKDSRYPRPSSFRKRGTRCARAAAAGVRCHDVASAASAARRDALTAAMRAARGEGDRADKRAHRARQMRATQDLAPASAEGSPAPTLREQPGQGGTA